MDEASAGVLQDLGRRLFQARVARGLTVRAAARLLGVDHSMIVRYENSQSLPPLDRLIALAYIYGSAPAAFLASNASAAPLIAAIDQADSSTLVHIERALHQALEP